MGSIHRCGSAKTASLVSSLQTRMMRRWLQALEPQAPDGPCLHCGRAGNHMPSESTGPRSCRRPRSSGAATQHWRRDGTRVRRVLDARCQVVLSAGHGVARQPILVLMATSGFLDRVPAPKTAADNDAIAAMTPPVRCCNPGTDGDVRAAKTRALARPAVPSGRADRAHPYPHRDHHA